MGSETRPSSTNQKKLLKALLGCKAKPKDSCDADLEVGAVTDTEERWLNAFVQHWAAVAQLSQHRIQSAAGERIQPPSHADECGSFRMHCPLLPVGMLAKIVFPMLFYFRQRQRRVLRARGDLACNALIEYCPCCHTELKYYSLFLFP